MIQFASFVIEAVLGNSITSVLSGSSGTDFHLSFGALFVVVVVKKE
jgi:hypothetical protein